MLTLYQSSVDNGYTEQIRFLCPSCSQLGSFFSINPKFCTKCGEGFVYLYVSLWKNLNEERLNYYRKTFG